MESSDSPDSVDEAESFSSPFSSFRRTARERSSANCATRRMAALNSSALMGTILLLSLGRTASKFGNCPVSCRDVSSRDPMRKNKVDSSFANSTVSASVESSSDFNSSIAFFGTKLFTGSFTVRQTVSVGRDHGDGLRLQQHQRAIQGVARLFIRNREPSPRNQ